MKDYRSDIRKYPHLNRLIEEHQDLLGHDDIRLSVGEVWHGKDLWAVVFASCGECDWHVQHEVKHD